MHNHDTPRHQWTREELSIMSALSDLFGDDYSECVRSGSRVFSEDKSAELIALLPASYWTAVCPRCHSELSRYTMTISLFGSVAVLHCGCCSWKQFREAHV